MKYELNEQTKNNLLVFLQRTELKGSEVVSFVELMQLFNNPIKDEVKTSAE